MLAHMSSIRTFRRRTQRKAFINFVFIFFALSIFLGRVAFASDLGPSEVGTDHPLLWESKRAEGKQWTEATKKMIAQHGPTLLRGTSDVKEFCPNFFSLSVPQKIHFWSFMISVLTRYESYYNPVVRYIEHNQGVDRVTGKPVASEGLLQLSYQDTLKYKFCDFDWSIDSKLSETDPKKTIFDPIKNLRCGIGILDLQVQKYDKFATDKGAYWAVIMPSHKNNRLAKIAVDVKQLPYCGH